MSRAKSARFRRAAQAASAEEAPLILLEIAHALLAQPLRFVNDVQDVMHAGRVYRAGHFAFTWPDDVDKQTPRGQLAISSIDGSVGAFLEATRGGQGAVLTVRQILRSQPDVLEDELVLDLSGLQVSTAQTTGQLGYDDILNRPGTPATYRPETAPGIY